MSDYLPMFQVEVRHEYFEPAGFLEHRLSPSPASARWLSRRGFRWVSEGAMHTLYADCALLNPAGGCRAWLKAAPDTLCFGFESSWPGFAWATALPGTAVDRIPIYTAALTRTKAGIQAQGPVVAALGRPAILDDGGEVPVLAEQDTEFRKPLLLLVVSGVIRKLERMLRGPGPGDTVSLRFSSRATTWRYHVFNLGGRGRGYRVEPANGRNGADGSNWPRFQSVAGIRGPGGAVSLSFESDPDQQIPMRWRPRERFQLVGKEGVLMQPLPLPGPALSRGSVRPVLCSEMVVNL